jgi:hypothetical protein
MYFLYIHLWLRCSNIFNPSKKNFSGYAAQMKIGNRKSQRYISTPMCSPVTVHCCFRGTCWLHLHSRRVGETNKLRLPPISYWLLVWLILWPWSRWQYAPPKHQLTRLQVVIPHIIWFLHTYLLTELSPSWEAANCAAIQEIPSNFKEPEGSSPRSQGPSIGPYPEPVRSSPYHPIQSLQDPS